MSEVKVHLSEDRNHRIVAHSQGCVISLTVSPRSPADRIEMDANGAIRVRITAPPVDGAANARLLKHLAAVLETAPTALSVLSGEQSRHKRILAKGVSSDQAWEAISAAAKRKG